MWARMDPYHKGPYGPYDKGPYWTHKARVGLMGPIWAGRGGPIIPNHQDDLPATGMKSSRFLESSRLKSVSAS